MEEKEIDNYVREYAVVRPRYEELTKETFDLIKKLLHIANIDFHAIEQRTKLEDSFRKKVIKEGKDYKEPLQDITDLSGVRIITYYQDDVDRIVDLIKNEFTIDEKNSIDKSKLMSPNEFGYLSVHYIVSTSKGRSESTEWKHLKDYKCEVQIRTVLQHSWASISHALQYKQKDDIPSKLQRKLFRLAGLFELADEQFLEIRDNNQIEKNNLASIQNIETTDSEINLLTVEKFINESPLVNQLFNKARELGFDVSSADPVYSFLVSILKHTDVKTIKELNNILSSNLDNSTKIFTGLFSKRQWHGDKALIVELIVVVARIEKLPVDELVNASYDQSDAKLLHTIAETLKT